MNSLRKRKPKNPCSGCGLNADLCICSQIPKLALRTKVSLVIHHREMKRTSNTGQLALRALTNSEMFVRGLETKPFELRDLLDDAYETLLLYPSDEAQELTSEYVRTVKKPIQLIVPDGNWRQASKVHYRNQGLTQIRRVKLRAPEGQGKELLLRKETKEEGMATLQAIALTLREIEGVGVGDLLMGLYETKRRATLAARGLFSSI